jgi:hypothetical protein
MKIKRSYYRLWFGKGSKDESHHLAVKTKDGKYASFAQFTFLIFTQP